MVAPVIVSKSKMPEKVAGEELTRIKTASTMAAAKKTLSLTEVEVSIQSRISRLFLKFAEENTVREIKEELEKNKS